MSFLDNKVLACIAIAAVTSGAAVGYYIYSNPDDGGSGILPTALVTFHTQTGNYTFDCDVANTVESRNQGLMNVESMSNESGMLFDYSTPQTLTFWMKNTLIPLDIIFIDENGVVLNIEEAYPKPGVADDNLQEYSSNGTAKWAVEINQGLSQAYGIIPGSTMEINYPV